MDFSYGTAHGYLDKLLESVGAKITLFHNELNPLFGGHHPEPNAENMADVSKFVRSGKAQIGLGTDGDADRFGIVDKDGTWLTPNQILALDALSFEKKSRLDGRGRAHRADEPSGGRRREITGRESL